MELKIEVDESMFKDILEKELLAFSKEELQDIIRDMVKAYLSKPEVIEQLFFEKTTGWSGYSKLEPAQHFKNTVAKIDFTEPVKELSDIMLKDLKENHREILEDLLYKSMAHQLMTSWMNEGWLEDAFREIRNREANRG